jgi:uncharacterized Zn finger protein
VNDFWRERPASGPRRAEGGLRARSRRGDIGERWWSRRFIEILESFDYGARLERGRYYARRGQVMDLRVRRGTVEASVQGSRSRPYRVRLGLEPLGEEDWERAEEAMAARAVFLAKLLAGQMPNEIEEAFSACQLSLLPASGRDLSSSCTCPDWAAPCKHVAAVFYILAEHFDDDPFLVFAWRGRTKEELIERLRTLRGRSRPLAPPSEPESQPASAAGPPLAECLDSFWQAGPGLEDVRMRPWDASAPDALIRQLGDAPLLVQGQNLGRVLARAYPSISGAASRRALGEA